MSTTITIQGNVTRKPGISSSSSGSTFAKFTVAVDRRSPARHGNGWVHSTSYFTVVAFDQLAVNVCDTLDVGSRVVVTGRLDQRSWESAAGEKRSSYELVADDVGASLRWAAGTLRRSVASGTMPVVVEMPELPGTVVALPVSA
jgi:single-strand DNA-binding protein